MANHYEDVDLMLLKRWDEVMALRRAFDDLMDRMREMIETTLGEAYPLRRRAWYVLRIRRQIPLNLVLEKGLGNAEFERAWHLLAAL